MTDSLNNNFTTKSRTFKKQFKRNTAVKVEYKERRGALQSKLRDKDKNDDKLMVAAE